MEKANNFQISKSIYCEDSKALHNFSVTLFRTVIMQSKEIMQWSKLIN